MITDCLIVSDKFQLRISLNFPARCCRISRRLFYSTESCEMSLTSRRKKCFQDCKEAIHEKKAAECWTLDLPRASVAPLQWFREFSAMACSNYVRLIARQYRTGFSCAFPVKDDVKEVELYRLRFCMSNQCQGSLQLSKTRSIRACSTL